MVIADVWLVKAIEDLHKGCPLWCDALNTIIDGIVEIFNAFLDEKGELWALLSDIVAELHIEDLIEVILRSLIVALTEALEMNVALTEALADDLDALIDALPQEDSNETKDVMERNHS